MGRTRAQGNSHRTIFLLEYVQGPPLPLIKLLSADKSYILFLQRRNRTIEFQPWCLLYGNDWGILLSLKVSGWSILLSITEQWMSDLSFYSKTKASSIYVQNAPVLQFQLEKKGRWEQQFIKQRHFYFILIVHPGAIALVTNSHCRKTV